MCGFYVVKKKQENVPLKWEKGEQYKKIEQPFLYNAIGR